VLIIRLLYVDLVHLFCNMKLIPVIWTLWSLYIVYKICISYMCFNSSTEHVYILFYICTLYTWYLYHSNICFNSSTCIHFVSYTVKPAQNQTFNNVDMSEFFVNLKCIRPKKNMCVSDCMVFKIRVGRSGFFFFKPTSMLLPLKSHKLVCFFLTTAY
jgi:hypothetical protein